MTLVAAILLGLRQRDRTGKGCWVGTSLYANGVWANGTLGRRRAGRRASAAAPAARQAANALTNLYRTKDDRWLQLLMVRDDRLWPAFCKAIERPDLAERSRASPNAPTAARDRSSCVADLMPVFAAQDLRRVGEALLSAPASPSA